MAKKVYFGEDKGTTPRRTRTAKKAKVATRAKRRYTRRNTDDTATTEATILVSIPASRAFQVGMLLGQLDART